MSNWFTKKRRGFLWWFGAFFFIFGGSAIARFFFDGGSLIDEWRSMAPQLVIVLVGAIVAGIALSSVEKSHLARQERNSEADQ